MFHVGVFSDMLHLQASSPQKLRVTLKSDAHLDADPLRGAGGRGTDDMKDPRKDDRFERTTVEPLTA